VPRHHLLTQLQTISTQTPITAPLLSELRKATEHDATAQALPSSTINDNSFVSKDGLIFHRQRIFVPTSMRKKILESIHDHPLAGHPGVRKNFDR
jgi:hypothetical protein